MLPVAADVRASDLGIEEDPGDRANPVHRERCLGNDPGIPLVAGDPELIDVSTHSRYVAVAEIKAEEMGVGPRVERVHIGLGISRACFRMRILQPVS
jgi:hypothetical protein